MATSDNGTVFRRAGSRTEDRSYPRLDAHRKDPEVDPIIKKLVAGNGPQQTSVRSQQPLRAPDPSLLNKISDTTTANITASQSQLQLLPDMGLAKQILVSSILSPKDMVSAELSYAVEPGQFTSELAGALLECLRHHFQSVYKITDLMPQMLEDALFDKGSYPLVILPENSIDDAINSPTRVTMESLVGELDGSTGGLLSVGFLGNPPAAGDKVAAKSFLGMESLTGAFGARRYDPNVTVPSGRFDPMLTVIDNPNMLKMPMLQDKLRQDRVQDMLAVRKLSMEANRESFQTGHGAEDRSLYVRRRYKHVPILPLTPGRYLKKGPIGHPLVMRLPSESVIPVHVPSNPSEHLGYFVLHDQSGNPLMRTNDLDQYVDMQRQVMRSQDAASQLLQSTRAATTTGNGQVDFTRQEEIAELERIYGDLVEAELTNRLRHGAYGDDVKVSRNQEVYRIMLTRALAKMQTQVLYIPAEMMVYVAFDYNQYGVGESLLQQSKVIGSIRAMLMFANTMSSLRNSVGHVNMNITLDPSDPDPQSTVEQMIHQYSLTRQGGMPLGVTRAHDLVNYMQNAGVQVTVQGNAAYPETRLAVEDVQSNRAKPDTELTKEMRDHHVMAVGLTPETVDAGANAEFATTITNNNLLLSKRVMMYQDKFVPMLEDFVCKYTLASGSLMDELRQIIEDNREKLNDEQRKLLSRIEDAKEAREDGSEDAVIDENRRRREEAEVGDVSVDAVIIEFLKAVRLSLPAPGTATLANQMSAFDAYKDALDKVLDAYFSADYLETSSMGKLSELVEPTKAALRAHFLRQWLRENNVLPEVDALTTLGEEDGPGVDVLKLTEMHLESIAKCLLPYMESLAKNRQKSDEKVDKIETATGGGVQTETTTDDTSGAGEDLGGGDGGDLDPDVDAAAGPDSTDTTDDDDDADPAKEDVQGKDDSQADTDDAAKDKDDTEEKKDDDKSTDAS